MALVPYDPFRQLENMRRELDRLFTANHSPIDFGPGLGGPSMDIYETENEIVAKCDIPGLEKKEDVQIEIDNNVLTVSGMVNKAKEIKDEHFYRQERFTGRFQRSVTLPSPVSPEGVKATYKNGVLEIRMPKVHSNTRRRIDIDFH